MNNLPASTLSLFYIKTIIINKIILLLLLLPVLFITITKCEHHYHNTSHRNHKTHHQTTIKHEHPNINDTSDKNYSYKNNSKINNTKNGTYSEVYTNSTLYNNSRISDINIINSTDYYFYNNSANGTDYYYFNYYDEVTTQKMKTTAPPTLSMRRAAYKLAGRIVRGIGAIGSANVVRGAIALFQRIKHPWKDKIFGTDPTTKKPASCTHPNCITGGASHRGFHHGNSVGSPQKQWIYNRKPFKQLTVKIIIDSTDKHLSNEHLKNPEKIGESMPDSFHPSLTATSLKAFLHPPEHTNMYENNIHPPFSYNNPWLHYEVGENNHFESFGKQEHGKLEPEPVKPRVHYFNPLLYRSRLTDFIKNYQKNFNESHCHLCKRRLDTDKIETKTNNIDDDDDDDAVGFFKRLSNSGVSPSITRMRRKFYWINKIRNIRKSLLKRLKPKKSPKHVTSYKRAYIDLLMRFFATPDSPLAPILNSPKYLSIIEKIVSNSMGEGYYRTMPLVTKIPLLPYYKN